jgi:uncharacterized protein YraI
MFIILTTLLLGSLSFEIAQAQGPNFGSNWQGQYYNNTSPNCNVPSGNPTIAEIVPQINFSWGSGSPNVLTNMDCFSAKWQGLQNFPADGTYRFTAIADDGVRVFVDGTLVIDNLLNTGTLVRNSADVNITAGTRDVLVEYVEFSGNAAIQFFWEAANVSTSGPTGTPTVTSLPPIPPGALAATVIRAAVLNVRDAPSLGGNVIGRILRGQTYAVVGRNQDATWFVLQLGGYQGWVYGYYLFVNGNEFNPPVMSATSIFGVPPEFNDTGVLVQTHAAMRLRAEPNIYSPQTGRITWGSFLPVSGRTAYGDWYQVLWKGTIGWVYTGFLTIEQGEFADIPVISP